MGSVRTPCVGEFSIMTRSRRRPVLLSLMVALLLVLHSDVAKPASALQAGYYFKKCPQLEITVLLAVTAARLNDERILASLVRLHFHDCFVNGCDASILLTGTGGEQGAFANANSARGFEVIDAIKTIVESTCPKQTVSCADILTLAARDSVVLAGGPTWTVLLGRYDSLTASQTDANNHIPAPFSDFTTLLANFISVGLSETDLVALSGAHTFGRAHCSTVNSPGNSRLYNYKGTGSPDPNMNSTFLKDVQGKCPRVGSDSVLNNLDVSTADRFDNAYYQNLLVQKGFLNSDQVLQYQSVTSLKAVQSYAASQSTWFSAFANSMIRMGNLSPKDSTNGEIRLQCGSRNS